ncbi:MAG: quinolinate phosphoribosyl transferase, partial [Acidobacteria bacterium]|nr:quinolinate phosphoribosyl transferase [Acidobacteriota bacterium]
FTNARASCELAGLNPRLLYQVFQRNHAVLCGMKYVIPLFEPLGERVAVFGLSDGEKIAPLEPVLHVTGNAQDLFELETLYLGLLSRMTRVATNVRAAVEAASKKPVLFFAARFDIPEAQEYDGYAALIGGAAGASTPAEAAAYGTPPIGTMPHALIAAFGGNTVAATLALARSRPTEPVWALVDFDNDCPRTSVAVLQALRNHGLKLAGVRLDTSAELVDECLRRRNILEHGVTAELVAEVRGALDENAGQDVRICASGGFHAERIREFERVGAPVDVYAVGERFLQGSNPFTSDVVARFENGKRALVAKIGRRLRENPRLRLLAGAP